MEDSSAQNFEKHNVSNSALVRTKAVEVVSRYVYERNIFAPNEACPKCVIKMIGHGCLQLLALEFCKAIDRCLA